MWLYMIWLGIISMVNQDVNPLPYVGGRHIYAFQLDEALSYYCLRTIPNGGTKLDMFAAFNLDKLYHYGIRGVKSVYGEGLTIS